MARLLTAHSGGGGCVQSCGWTVHRVNIEPAIRSKEADVI